MNHREEQMKSKIKIIDGEQTTIKEEIFRNSETSSSVSKLLVHFSNLQAQPCVCWKTIGWLWVLIIEG